MQFIMAFVYSQVRTTTTTVNFRTYSPPLKEASWLSLSSSGSPKFWQPLTYFLSWLISLFWPFSHAWNRICGLFCLASFLSECFLSSSILQRLSVLHTLVSWIIFHCRDRPCSVHPSISWWTFGFFQFLTVSWIVYLDYFSQICTWEWNYWAIQ